MDITKLRLVNLESIIETKFSGSSTAFADEVGIASAEISQIRNNDNQRNIGPSLARRIEVAAGLDRGWMDKDHHIKNLFASVPLILSGETTIKDNKALRTNSDDHVYIERKILDAHGVEPEKCIAIKMLSDSMAPKLNVGDIAFINMGVNYRIDSGTFAIIDNGLICVRKIHFMPNKGLMLTALGSDSFTTYYNENQNESLMFIGQIFFYMGSWQGQ